MNAATEVWGLWDAQELLSVHLTEPDARNALEEHLDRCLSFRADQDVIVAAVEIRRTCLIDPGPPDDPASDRANTTDPGGS